MRGNFRTSLRAMKGGRTASGKPALKGAEGQPEKLGIEEEDGGGNDPGDYGGQSENW